jgi:hypothetical protein
MAAYKNPLPVIMNKEATAMLDYYPLRNTNHKLPEPEPKEAQVEQQPVAVDLVYNTYTERNGKTIALTVSFRLPLLHGEVPTRA